MLCRRGGFNIFLRKLYFGFGFSDSPGLHEFVAHDRVFNPGAGNRLRLPDPFGLPVNFPAGCPGGLLCLFLIVLDSSCHGFMRLFSRPGIGKIVFIGNMVVIVDHRGVDDGRCLIPVDMIHISNSYGVVIRSLV